jgi:hypothetical protein
MNARSAVAGRRTLVAAFGLGIIATGAVLNWDWLVAIGAAPVILAVLPCLVMCGVMGALGLCSMSPKRSCDGATETKRDAQAERSRT